MKEKPVDFMQYCPQARERYEDGYDWACCSPATCHKFGYCQWKKLDKTEIAYHDSEITRRI